MYSFEKEVKLKMIKEFCDEKGVNLIIEHNKSNIIFKTDDKNIKNNYDFYKCIFSKNGDLSFLFKLEEMVENHLRDQLKEKFNKRESNLGYVYSFFKSGYIGILKKWMEGGCEESSSEIAGLTYNLLKSIVDTCRKQLEI